MIVTKKIDNNTSSISRPIVSIITTTYQAEKTLERSILSVITQDRSIFEYIIIDGCSTDGTLDIVKQYKDSIDICISEPDEGVYDAMNKGIDMARGEWLYFLGGDDELLNILSKIKSLLVDPRKIYYGNVLYPNQLRIYKGKVSTYRFIIENISHQAIFYPRSVFIGNRYSNCYPINADYALNINLWNSLDFAFTYVPIAVAVHNDENGLSKDNRDVQFYADRPALIRESLGSKWYVVFLAHKLAVRLLDIFGMRKSVARVLGW